MGLDDPQFWIAVLQIIAIDIVLGGDNAVVIALACRRLPEQQRKLGIFWGVFGAIMLRVILIFFALNLLALPFLKITGAVLLVWIGVKLLQPEPEGDHQVDASTSLLGAIKTIIVADAVMSLDNVIAIAGAAKDEIGLVIFGLVISVPIIVWGSQFVMRVMDRYPVTIAIGAGLLGWIAGGMAVSDVVTKEWVDAQAKFLHWFAPVASAMLVIVAGKFFAARKPAKVHPVVDLAEDSASKPTTDEQKREGGKSC
ncbi:MAG: TerC family protein [Nitrosomonas sp.]|nr:MAG: TerC family protein [Nitrosomonas sp.]